MESEKILVVLDLNGTILDSTHHLRAGTRPHAKARRKFVYFRPYMKEFLNFLFSHENIEVGIWTSNIAENAQAVVQTAFTPEQQNRLAFIMSRSDCRLGPNFTSFKHMSAIFQRGYAPNNVIFIDDSKDKVVPADFPGWIRVEEFQASPASLGTDRALRGIQATIENAVGKKNGPFQK